MAMKFRTSVIAAQPWITWIRRSWLKSASARPKTTAASTMPNSSMSESTATTFGCDSRGARSVASARPTVCTACIPAPTIRNAIAAEACATQGGAQVSPDSTISAKGIIASPPNCTMVPSQI